MNMTSVGADILAFKSKRSKIYSRIILFDESFYYIILIKSLYYIILFYFILFY